MAELIKSDLEFILQQILIAEAHAAGTDLRSLLPNELAMLGLRTVDGSYNNLVPGQQYFGAADQDFPRLLDPVFQAAQLGTSYTQTSGLVIDSEPRTISNLIVDQTANNPAAVEANGGADPVISPGLDGIFGTLPFFFSFFSSLFPPLLFLTPTCEPTFPPSFSPSLSLSPSTPLSRILLPPFSIRISRMYHHYRAYRPDRPMQTSLSLIYQPARSPRSASTSSKRSNSIFRFPQRLKESRPSAGARDPEACQYQNH